MGFSIAGILHAVNDGDDDDMIMLMVTVMVVVFMMMMLINDDDGGDVFADAGDDNVENVYIALLGDT